jgi:hypothetical protein
MIAFNRLPQDFSRSEKVILAYEFIQCPRPHSVGERGLSLE